MQQYCQCCQNQLSWFWSNENASSGEVRHYSESLLKTATELSWGETSSSRSSQFTEKSYCSWVWVPNPCPFPGITTFADLPGALGSCQVSTAGLTNTSHVKCVSKSCSFCLSSVKCLYPLLGRWSQAFSVSHLSANGAGLGRKCVLTAPDLGGVLAFVKDKLILQMVVGTWVPPLLSSSETTSGELCPVLGAEVVVQETWA